MASPPPPVVAPEIRATGWRGRLAGQTLAAPCWMWMLCLLTALCAQPARAAERKVLVLYSLGTDSASVWQTMLRRGVSAGLDAQPPGKLPDIFEERLDGIRVGSETAIAAMAPYLRDKYANIKFDTVITENYTASRFLSAHPELFAGVPRFYVNHGQSEWHPRDGTGIEAPTEFRRAIGVIPGVMPDVRRIVIVGDRSPRGLRWVSELRALIPEFGERIQIDIWDNYTFAELYRQAATLGRHTAIFMLPIYQDASGAKGLPPVVARALVNAAKVPVFTGFESLIVGGVTGGYVLSAHRMGAIIADIMLQRRPDPGTLHDYVFDYQAMQHHHLHQLPDGAILMNKSQGLWESYRWQIMGSLMLFLLQAALISALIMALRDRRRTMAALNDERDKLEERVVQRTLELLVVNNKLEQLAATDPLTGIGNRRKMTEQIGQELERARRLRRPLALLMIDIDHFKRINDNHGHEVGDRAIVLVAATLNEARRAIDMLSRFGGEEFVLLMPETALDGAVTVAERLRVRIAALRIATGETAAADAAAGHDADDGSMLGLTISIGVAAFDPLASDDNPGSLLVRADKALYRAKKGGRNCVMY